MNKKTVLNVLNCVALAYVGYAAARSIMKREEKPTITGNMGQLILLRPGTKPGYVYIIRAKGTNQYKIGFTRMPVEKRLKALQTSSPQRLELVADIEAHDPEQAERNLHRNFSDNRLSGEWFELDKKEISEAITELGFHGNKDYRNSEYRFSVQ